MDRFELGRHGQARALPFFERAIQEHYFFGEGVLNPSARTDGIRTIPHPNANLKDAANSWDLFPAKRGHESSTMSYGIVGSPPDEIGYKPATPKAA